MSRDSDWAQIMIAYDGKMAHKLTNLSDLLGA